jgi:predicted Zn-dependent protease
MDKQRSTRGHLVRAVTVALLAIHPAGCALNPATGERQLSLISEAQEVELGRQAAQQVAQTMGFIDDSALAAYVRRIGAGLAASSERPQLPWEFHIVDDPTPNAFALPGGFIYITRGMLNMLTSEAELANVLCHEIAHVTARHSVIRISQQQVTRLGLGIGGILFPAVQELAPLVGAGLDLLFLKHSRNDEREADEIGSGYVAREGYSVAESADVFATLQRAGDGQSNSLPGWLSTHPAPAERVATAEARAAKVNQAGGRINRDQYLRQIDGLVYGRNPRRGFFRDGTFYHPELRFQLGFPPGWHTQNLSQAVVGVPPDGIAVIELTLSPVPDESRALMRFASQPGIDVGRATPLRLDGVSGLSAQFIGRTSGDRIRGVAAFVTHRGRVYQLAGYSLEQYYGAMARTLTGSIESFRPVSDPSVLAIEPHRIEVVQLERPQTLAEFVERYPSVVSIEELAIINHVQGASAPLAAGTPVKRVVS